MKLVGDAVELDRRDAGLDALSDVRDRLRDERARAGDAVDLGRALADDHAAAPSSRSSSASSISVETSSIDRICVQGHELARRAVPLDDGLGLLVVDREPAGDRVGRVVLATLVERTTADPLDRELVREVEEEDGVERPRDVREHLVERFRLREVAREAVEHEPGAGIGCGEPFSDQRAR